MSFQNRLLSCHAYLLTHSCKFLYVATYSDKWKGKLMIVEINLFVNSSCTILMYLRMWFLICFCFGSKNMNESKWQLYKVHDILHMKLYWKSKGLVKWMHLLCVLTLLFWCIDVSLGNSSFVHFTMSYLYPPSWKSTSKNSNVCLCNCYSLSRQFFWQWRALEGSFWYFNQVIWRTHF